MNLKMTLIVTSSAKCQYFLRAFLIGLHTQYTHTEVAEGPKIWGETNRNFLFLLIFSFLYLQNLEGMAMSPPPSAGPDIPIVRLSNHLLI